MAEADVPPRVSRQVLPTYPAQARRRRLEGKVTLKFLVNSEGRVEQATVLAAEPENVFENHAVEAIRQWEFSPGRINGMNVAVWMVLPIRFELKDR